jgi:hypothetical protein
LRATYGRGVEGERDHLGGRGVDIGIEARRRAAAAARVDESRELRVLHRRIEEPRRRGATQDAAREERRRRRPLKRQMIGMVVAAMRVVRDDHARLEIANHLANGGFDLEHVRDRQRARVVPLKSVAAAGVVKSEEPRLADAQPRAREPQFLRSQCRHILDVAERRNAPCRPRRASRTGASPVRRIPPDAPACRQQRSRRRDERGRPEPRLALPWR